MNDQNTNCTLLSEPSTVVTEKQQVYVLISIFGDDIRVLNIGGNLEAMVRQMKRVAMGAICDEVGKNNFVDTLDSQEFKNKNAEECPAGFVIKFGQIKGAVRALFVSKNIQCTSMLFRKYCRNEPVGKYMIIEAENADISVSNEKTNSVTAAEFMPCNVRRVHDDLMVELSNKLRERRSKFEQPDNQESFDLPISINGSDSLLVVRGNEVEWIDQEAKKEELVFGEETVCPLPGEGNKEEVYNSSPDM